MKTTSKRLIGFVASALLACSIVGFTGCSSQPTSSSSASTSSSASSFSPSQTGASNESASSGSAAIANPWSDVASADEAAKGAGLDAFALPEGEIADMGKPFEITYRYMDGMAEARLEFPAAAITARTSSSEGVQGADISGDYNTYAHEWTEEIGGVTVTCAGNREGDSTRTYWNVNGLYHSLVAEGLGGDENFGLTPERIAVFVEAMK